MKDLYRRLELWESASADSIRAALGRSWLDATVRRAAEHILLNAERRQVYDRHRRILVTIGQLRANLGLSDTEGWIGADCKDFDVVPSWKGPRWDDSLLGRRGAGQQPASGRPTSAKTRAHHQSQWRERDQRASGHPASTNTLAAWGLVAAIAIGLVFVIAQMGESENVPPRNQETRVVHRRPLESVYSPPVVASDPLVPASPVPVLHPAGASPAAPASAPPAFNEPQLPAPPTGVLTVDDPTAAHAVAPFEIKTAAGGNHYYVKLVGWGTNRTAMTAFIRGGESIKTKVSLGSYELRYAAGEAWYGTTHLFGPDTAYSRAKKKFEFTRTSKGYSGYTVELFLQADGNLKTERIRPEEF